MIILLLILVLGSIRSDYVYSAVNKKPRKPSVIKKDIKDKIREIIKRNLPKNAEYTIKIDCIKDRNKDIETEIFSFNKGIPMRIHSMTSIFISACALEKLGAEYKFRTYLFKDKYENDLYLIGSGDPTFNSTWYYANDFLRPVIDLCKNRINEGGKIKILNEKMGKAKRLCFSCNMLSIKISNPDNSKPICSVNPDFFSLYSKDKLEIRECDIAPVPSVKMNKDTGEIVITGEVTKNYQGEFLGENLDLEYFLLNALKENTPELSVEFTEKLPKDYNDNLSFLDSYEYQIELRNLLNQSTLNNYCRNFRSLMKSDEMEKFIYRQLLVALGTEISKEGEITRIGKKEEIESELIRWIRTKAKEDPDDSSPDIVLNDFEGSPENNSATVVQIVGVLKSIYKNEILREDFKKTLPNKDTDIPGEVLRRTYQSTGANGIDYVTSGYLKANNKTFVFAIIFNSLKNVEGNDLDARYKKINNLARSILLEVANDLK